MYIGLHVQCPLFLSDFNETNFMKIRPVGAELFHADGRTGGRMNRRKDIMRKLIVVFRNFANSPSKVKGTTDFY